MWNGAGVGTVHSSPSAPSQTLGSLIGLPHPIVRMTLYKNREFLENGMMPPSPVKDLDLMSVVKANFQFPSNKLDYVAQKLGVGAKFKHSGFQLWIDCMAGNEKAWVEMKKYQIQDVNLLIDLYDILLPWFVGKGSVTSRDKQNIVNGELNIVNGELVV